MKSFTVGAKLFHADVRTDRTDRRNEDKSLSSQKKGYETV